MKKKLTLIAYEFIKEKIVNNEYKVKQILNEKEISEILKISKTPVKEALARLENENFLVINPRKFTKVQEVNLKLIKDVFQIRSKIEPLLVELTISIMDKNELKKNLLNFRKKFELMMNDENVSGSKFDDLYDSYKLFFTLNCGNLFFSQQMKLVYEHLRRIRKVLYGNQNRRLAALEEHIIIIDAIIENKPFEDIKKLCELHIEAAQIDFFKNLDKLSI